MVSCGSRPCSSEVHCECLNDIPGNFDRCSSNDFAQLYPDMEDCASYFNCTAGCFERYKCPGDYLYRIDNEWCSHPEEIQCGERPCFDEERCGNNFRTFWDTLSYWNIFG